MNKDQTAKWLKFTFLTSLSIFFLASVRMLDSNISAYGFFRILTDSPDLYQIINIVQYLNIGVFLVTVIMTFRQRQDLQTVIMATVWGGGSPCLLFGCLPVIRNLSILTFQ